MDFWRGPAYTDFFKYLEEKGGFYYEVRVILSPGLRVALIHVQRWGDAPVHSIAAALFVKKEQIHFWDEIGYEHNPYTHCPQKEKTWKQGKCSCNQQRSFGKYAP
jgi:alpha 1,2-mannosyltransferase